MGDEYKDSQQDPEQDSALQTPQPDQPHPPVGSPPMDSRREDQTPDSPPVEVDVNVDVPATPGND